MEESTRFTENNLACPDFALGWVKTLGLSLNTLTPLHGGINNHVFVCGSAKEKNQYVIKGYAKKSALTDRMIAEVEFLRYAEKVSPSFVPKLLEVDYEQRCVVLEYIDGSAYVSGVSPSKEDVMQAANFFRQLNTDRSLAIECIHQGAAEGFLSISEHLNNVQDRLNLMTVEHIPHQVKHKAGLLLKRMCQEFENLAHQTMNLIDAGDLQDVINFNDCCLSPSDFGFHNAIRSINGVKFIDFEFAGWDDPAKTILDFKLQPRIPVSPYQSKVFADYYIRHGGRVMAGRVLALGPILRTKWLCIMLSVLRPDRLSQISNVIHNVIDVDFIDQKLEEAKAYIHREFSFGLY